ncbi:MAG: hypothetical protein WC708_06180 [Lentisphaeria bacterium]
MQTAFDVNKGEWRINWPGRVARHDLVYLTPPTDPMQGLAIGNGEVGVLGWCEGSKLIFVVNKSDLWDDAAFGRFHNWQADEEEHSTTLRHGCRIILDFKLPVFDLFYLQDFTARLSLADASLQLTVAGPFGTAAVWGFVDHASGIFAGEVDCNFTEPVPLEMVVERFGSRTFSHWYSLVNRDPALGLAGTAAQADRDGAYVTHALTGGTFAAGCRILAGKGLQVAATVEHSHAAKLTVTGGREKHFSFLAGITSPLPKNPAGVLKKQLAAAQKKGVAALFAGHRRAWKAFWTRSLMEFGDDYLDNLWHVTMFYAACSQRGAYPGRFINGLWSWNRDVQNWNFYFHWNQQQIYWPLNAAGHHNLLESYLNYRFNALPYGREDAKTAFGTEGALVSDVSERRGYNSASEFANHTPVAQVAMEFWRQYKFTGDREFLKRRAVPYLVEAATFFASRFEKGRDGQYHAREGTGYEGWIHLHDGVTELVYALVLFPTALAALKEAGMTAPQAATWAEIVRHLAPLPTLRDHDAFLQNGRFSCGLFKGDRAFSDTLLAAGYGIKEKAILTSFLPGAAPGTPAVDAFEALHQQEGKPVMPDKPVDDIRCHDGIFPWVEEAAVFPSGLVGVGQADTPLYQAAANSVKAFAGPGMGWAPHGIALARLGLAQEARRILDLWPVFWQFYVNGWGHYGPAPIMKAESSVPGRHQNVMDASLPPDVREKQKFNFGMWPFRHMGMEAMSVLATTMNEVLLQSHEGVIRVAPAAVKAQTARFTLHAEDGFVVSAEIVAGRPAWVAVTSRLGKPCRMANPWRRAVVYENGRKLMECKKKQIEFATVTGRRYLLAPDAAVLREWHTVPTRPQPNRQAKSHASQYATLGLPRRF